MIRCKTNVDQWLVITITSQPIAIMILIVIYKIITTIIVLELTTLTIITTNYGFILALLSLSGFHASALAPGNRVGSGLKGSP